MWKRAIKFVKENMHSLWSAGDGTLCYNMFTYMWETKKCMWSCNTAFLMLVKIIILPLVYSGLAID